MPIAKGIKGIILATKGFKTTGAKIEKSTNVENAKKDAIDYLVNNIAKQYAELDLLKEIGWIDETKMKLIIDSATSIENTKAYSRMQQKAKLASEINKVLKDNNAAPFENIDSTDKFI